MSNSDKENFDRMVQLADFGARQHSDRRTGEFKVFIGYVTLLALALYKIAILVGFIQLFVAFIGLLIMHYFYVKWQINLSRAFLNDANRRNFYLKKAECIAHHLSKKTGTSFRPSETVKVTIDRKDQYETDCPEDDKIFESELFEHYEPPIILNPDAFKVHRDWSRRLHIAIPSILVIIIGIILLIKCCEIIASELMC